MNTNEHIFAETSSPSYCIYALRCTATGNKHNLGKEAAVTLEKKSFLILAQISQFSQGYKINNFNVISICGAGGFNLTNFTSNRKEVLLSIPDERRRKGVNIQDLPSGEIHQEWALGIIWQIEEDTQGFQFQLLKGYLHYRTIFSSKVALYV